MYTLRHSHAPWLVLLALLILLLAIALTARSAGAIPDVPPPAATLDSGDLETFLDGVVTAQLQAYHIAGATVSFVQDGRLQLAKGYGYAAPDQQRRVSADETLFRPGSISKLLTWTAVLQLVEQGRLDLDTDINTYLRGFQVPATYPQPITLRHLATHTAGFEDQTPGVFVRRPSDLEPLAVYLAANMPARVRPPGELAAYSNYGVALAGLIVEQVAGTPFEQYMDEHILQPLDMRHSTFRQPLPPDLLESMAAGYAYQAGAWQPAEFEVVQAGPAGALSSTATDMAHFMIAQLQGGQYGGARLLSPASVRAMQTQQFTPDPRVGGWGIGFMELNSHGQRFVWHGGATANFHSALVLSPEHGWGLFVSFKSPTGFQAHQDLLNAFLDRYYPVAPPARRAPPADFAGRARQLVGTYVPTRSNYTTPEKLVNLVQPVEVGMVDGSRLVTTIPVGLNPVRQWTEVEPYVFQSLDGADRLVFQVDAAGRVVHMFLDNYPIAAFEKQPWYGSTALHRWLLLLWFLVFGATLVVWPSGAALSRRLHLVQPGMARAARWLAVALSLVCVVFMGGFLALISGVNIVYGLPPLLVAWLWLPWLIVGLTIPVVVFALAAWWRGFWGLAGRLHYSLLAGMAVVGLWFMAYWNLL